MTITNEQLRLANDFKVTEARSYNHTKAVLEDTPILMSETFKDRYITGRHLPSKMDSFPIAFRRMYSSHKVMLHEGDVAYFEDCGDIYLIEGVYRDSEVPARPRMPKHHKFETLWQFQVLMKRSIEGCVGDEASTALCHILTTIIGLNKFICTTNAPADVLKTSFNQAMDAIYPVIAGDLEAYDHMRAQHVLHHDWKVRTDLEYATTTARALYDELTGYGDAPDEMIDILLRSYGVIAMVRAHYCEQFMLDEFEAYVGRKIDQMRRT